jgi:hypothetical protein
MILLHPLSDLVGEGIQFRRQARTRLEVGRAAEKLAHRIA